MKKAIVAAILLTAKMLLADYVCYLDDFPKEKKVKKAASVVRVERIDFAVGATIVVKTKAKVETKTVVAKESKEERAEMIVNYLVKEHERVYKTGDLKIVKVVAKNIYVRYDKVADTYEMVYIPLKDYNRLQERVNKALEWVKKGLSDTNNGGVS